LFCRHVHHFYDGVALFDVLPRRPHFLVSLDWIRDPALRAVCEGFCRLTEWPATIRDAGPAVRSAAALLRRGEVVAVFAEGYVVTEPGRAIEIVEFAQRDGDLRVPIVPVGVRCVQASDGYDVSLRLGVAKYLDPRTDRDALLASLAARVRELSV
jgi:hypothetical protein